MQGEYIFGIRFSLFYYHVMILLITANVPQRYCMHKTHSWTASSNLSLWSAMSILRRQKYLTHPPSAGLSSISSFDQLSRSFFSLQQQTVIWKIIYFLLPKSLIFMYKNHTKNNITLTKLQVSKLVFYAQSTGAVVSGQYHSVTKLPVLAPFSLWPPNQQRTKSEMKNSIFSPLAMRNFGIKSTFQSRSRPYSFGVFPKCLNTCQQKSEITQGAHVNQLQSSPSYKR